MDGKKYFAEDYEILESTTRCDINKAIKDAVFYAGDSDVARIAASDSCPEGGLVVRYNPDGTFQVKSGDYHSVIVAMTRAGKTRRVIVPMLTSLILADKSNFVVNDPKGELIESTRGLLTLLGYKIVTLDFRHPGKSQGCYNPLDSIWMLWNAGEQDRAVDQLLDFADLINTELAQKTDDLFWPNASKDLFAGIALLLLELDVPRDEFNIASISAAEAVGAKNNFKLFRQFCDAHRNQRSFEFLAEASFAPNDTAASIRSVFRSSISNFVGRNALLGMMSESTCHADTFLKERVALFIHTPDESASFSPIVAAVVSQLVTTLITRARALPGGRLPRQLEIVLDEFGNLRSRIADFDMMLAAACGHGIHCHLVMQSLSQFDYVYGNVLRKIVLDNVEQWIYLGSRSLDTNKYFSDMLGTVQDPAYYYTRPLMDVATLQRLERRRDESEAVMLIGSLKPFVSALPDQSCFEEVRVSFEDDKEVFDRHVKVFDLEARSDCKPSINIDELLARARMITGED